MLVPWSSLSSWIPYASFFFPLSCHIALSSENLLVKLILTLEATISPGLTQSFNPFWIYLCACCERVVYSLSYCFQWCCGFYKILNTVPCVALQVPNCLLILHIEFVNPKFHVNQRLWFWKVSFRLMEINAVSTKLN